MRARLELSLLTAGSRGSSSREPQEQKGPNSRPKSSAACPAVSAGPQRPAIWLGMDAAMLAQEHQGPVFPVGQRKKLHGWADGVG